MEEKKIFYAIIFFIKRYLTVHGFIFFFQNLEFFKVTSTLSIRRPVEKLGLLIIFFCVINLQEAFVSMSQFIPTLWILPVLFLLISLILNAALYSREVAILIASFVNTDLGCTNFKKDLLMCAILVC
jgi:hypothetical protein